MRVLHVWLCIGTVYFLGSTFVKSEPAWLIPMLLCFWGAMWLGKRL